MTLVTCRNGHRYDPEITSECPECAILRSSTIPLVSDIFYPGADSVGKTVPLRRDTIPIGETAVPAKQSGKPNEDYGATMPVNYAGLGMNNKVKRLLAGWLVCVEGPEKGMDYRLHDEYNYIGRSSSMDVCIAEDPTVSRENHAIIAYDSQERVFFFAPCSGASIVRHNGKTVLNTVELKQGDRLQIGKGTFLFVPLCGDSFQW